MKITYSCLIVIVVIFNFTRLVVATTENESQSDKITDSISDKPQLKRQISALATIEKCNKDRKICLESCKGDSNCTDTCPVCAQVERVPPIVKPGVEIVNRNYIINGINGTSERYSVSHAVGANYTTIFRLQNFINNTNLIKVPTHVNSTNINHINIFNNETSDGVATGDFGLGSTEDGPCCIAVQPKSCRSTPTGPRCHHRRHKTCGVQCTSRSIHVHARNKCHGQHCRRGLSYIPQPQPRCFHTQYWPYVNCGGQQRRDCSGCYDHYGHYSSNYQVSENNCGGCYDDGFSYGQLYRRGPVFRPFYYHEPPCYITGSCSYETGYYQNSYGYYGGPEVDPVLGPGNVFNDDDEVDENSTALNSSDWGVVIEKCKTVNENGTVKIENCVGAKENPYAASPIALTNEDSVPPPYLPYYPAFAPVVLPAIYNPAIDYEYYSRTRGSYRGSKGKVPTKFRRNKRKISRRRVLKQTNQQQK